MGGFVLVPPGRSRNLVGTPPGYVYPVKKPPGYPGKPGYPVKTPGNPPGFKKKKNRFYPLNPFTGKNVFTGVPPKPGKR
jgi:hypothetical protein